MVDASYIAQHLRRLKSGALEINSPLPEERDMKFQMQAIETLLSENFQRSTTVFTFFIYQLRTVVLALAAS